MLKETIGEIFPYVTVKVDFSLLFQLHNAYPYKSFCDASPLENAVAVNSFIVRTVRRTEVMRIQYLIASEYSHSSRLGIVKGIILIDNVR